MSCENEHYHGHTHGHSHSHGDGDDHSHIAPMPTSEAHNLRQYIDFHKLTALNVQQPKDDLQKVFKEQNDRLSLEGFIESDSDAQFVLNIPFTGNVKLHSIILRTSGDAEHCPKTIKLFKNKNNLDFDNIGDTKPTHKLEQPEVGPMEGETSSTDEDTFVEHHLPRAQFQGTTHLTLFIEDNWADDEDETTKLYYIELRGLYTSGLSKDPVIALYESAANPADHRVGATMEQQLGINRSSM